MTNLTNNEKAAIVAFINSCLGGMGGSVPEDLNDDPYTWVGVEDLVAAGWGQKQAEGTMGSLTDKQFIYEADKNEYALTDAFDEIFPIWHEAKGDPEFFKAKSDTLNFSDDKQHEIDSAHMGESKRDTCARLRTAAVGWTGTRKAFIEWAVSRGFNKATAGTQWQRGRKGA